MYVQVNSEMGVIIAGWCWIWQTLPLRLNCSAISLNYIYFCWILVGRENGSSMWWRSKHTSSGVSAALSFACSQTLASGSQYKLASMAHILLLLPLLQGQASWCSRTIKVPSAVIVTSIACCYSKPCQCVCLFEICHILVYRSSMQ